MAFWSGEQLDARLPALLGKYFNPKAVKSARYALCIGAEAYVTSSTASGGPKRGVTFPLKPNEAFKIPPGQFAFLLTEECIAVPNDALALISIRTHLKYQGLVNVSGFHVDPGWKGHLKFGIYNAGPQDVQLRRGEEMFLIWYADLDRKSERLYVNRPDKCAPTIPGEYTNNMSAQMYSPQVLAGLIRKLESRLTATWYIASTILAAVTLILVGNVFERKAPSPTFIFPQPPAAAAPVPTNPERRVENAAASVTPPQPAIASAKTSAEPNINHNSDTKNSNDAKGSPSNGK